MVRHAINPWTDEEFQYDVIKIGNDLVEWAEKENSLNLNKFCAYYENRFPATYFALWCGLKDARGKHFKRCMDIARAYLAARREEAVTDGKLHVKPYDLCARVYDRILKQDLEEEQRFSAELGKEVNEHLTESYEAQMNLMMSQISSLRSSLNKDTNTINNDA